MPVTAVTEVLEVRLDVPFLTVEIAQPAELAAVLCEVVGFAIEIDPKQVFHRQRVQYVVDLSIVFDEVHVGDPDGLIAALERAAQRCLLLEPDERPCQLGDHGTLSAAHMGGWPYG